jgi:lipoate-protein ligase A
MFMKSEWRFIDTGSGEAYWNMAVDEALLHGCVQGDRPILRLYGWENALSLGRFSNPSHTLHLDTMHAENIPYVRRMSGGGVLVHGGDLSYALIMPRSSVDNRGVKENYHYLCRFLIRLYDKLGLEACFASEMNLQTKQSEHCLASNEAYDIMINGQKMGGNAQRYTRNAVFQHGTIPIRIDGSKFHRFFVGESGIEGAATLENLGVLAGYEELKNVLIEAFCETFGVNLLTDTLRDSEINNAHELIAQKYSQEGWNIHGKYVAS